MRILRITFALAASASLLVGLAGCLTDSPLTPTASTNIDTRLLGVFEFDPDPGRRGERKADGDEVKKKATQRVAVVPRSPDEYLVYHLELDKKPPIQTTYVGWISQVDTNYYLTLEDITEGSSTRGKFTFLRFTWRFPGNIILFAPDVKGLENVTSYEMRQAVRSRLKEDTLFPFEGTYWNKIARVWWDPNAEDQTVVLPKEFEKGTSRNYPGL